MSDRVSVGVTHQVRIGREDAWIKVEYNVEVRPSESLEGATDRANEVLQEKIFDVITSTVEAVKAFEEKQ